VNNRQPFQTPGITINGVIVDENGKVVINRNLTVGDVIVGGSDGGSQAAASI
jgi:hypothetical protein